MKQATTPPDTSIPVLIARLVDGELHDFARRDLLARIDRDQPERWRDLALGLLAGRLLTEALRDGATERPARRRSFAPTLVAAAAAVVLGLFAGAQLPRQSPPAESPLVASPPGDAPLMSTTDVSPGPWRDDQAAPAVFEPERFLNAAALQAAETQRELARRGIPASIEARLVSADLEDGSRVLIPVSRVMSPALAGGAPDHHR